jgi:hypothetical protein
MINSSRSSALRIISFTFRLMCVRSISSSFGHGRASDDQDDSRHSNEQDKVIAT